MAGSALESAFKILAVRDHSETELRRKLTAKGYPSPEVESVLERLKGLGYLDEKRFARSFAESAIRNGRGYGARLRMELARRGVPAAVSHEVLEELSEEYGEAKTLSELISRRFPGFEGATASDKEKRRVVGYLQRKGFTLSAIFAQLRLRGEE